MIAWLITKTPLFYLWQPLWRDEAFSVLLSQNSPLPIIRLTAADFNPPLYYLMLHFYMSFFGSGEITIRWLSFTAHLLTVWVAVCLARKFLFPKNRLFLVLTALLVFFNPMLLYYAFEARMYSWLTLFASLSLYFFLTKQSLPYIIFSTLGLYTQPFMAFVLLSQFIYCLLVEKLAAWQKRLRDFLLSALFFFPWLLVIVNRLRTASDTWFYPVDGQLVKSVLGNLYLGYEGTPGYFWTITGWLSLVFMILIIFSFRLKKSPQKLLFISLFLPLILVIGISFLKPIFVNRYLIFTVLPLILLLVIGIGQIRSRFRRLLTAGFFFLLTFSFNFWFVPAHLKTDFKKTMVDIDKQFQPEDHLISRTPLSLFEMTYYAKKQKVFLYNPENRVIPQYVGRAIIADEMILKELPVSGRTFLINDDASYEIIEP